MPCAMNDVSIATTSNGGESPKDIVYRPLHVLPGFNFTSEHWAREGLQREEDQSSLRIDLLEGFTRSWKDLGFGHLDNTEKSGRKGSKEVERIRSTIGEWRLVLKYTAIHGFDVNRGLW